MKKQLQSDIADNSKDDNVDSDIDFHSKGDTIPSMKTKWYNILTKEIVELWWEDMLKGVPIELIPIPYPFLHGCGKVSPYFKNENAT